MNQAQTFRTVLIVGFLVVLPIAAYYRLKSQATRETLDRWQEEKLLARFGDAYRRYRERTGRFLPNTRMTRRGT